jgi:CRP/FNR family transcriptional regulator, cyclic AMP receptor protein
MAKKVKKVPFDPKVFLATANGGRTLAKYRTDQVIFSQGDPADAVFYIQKGRVKVTVISEQGKEAIVAVMGPDDFCGEGCLTGQPRHLATAAAMTECEIMRLEKLAMIRVLHEEPAFSEMFISHLLVRTIRVEADLVDQLFNSSKKRLARALLLLANFGKEGRPEPIIAKVSQETLLHPGAAGAGDGRPQGCRRGGRGGPRPGRRCLQRGRREDGAIPRATLHQTMDGHSASRAGPSY